jgi:xylan 1,4-beta-xylosidase
MDAPEAKILEERHEIISFADSLPIKAFIHRLGNVDRHWHQSLEFLLVLDGQVHIVTEGKHYHLEPDDVILINSNAVHELMSDDCVLIAVQIKLSKFDIPPEDAKNFYFHCNSAMKSNKSQFSRLKAIIAQLMKVGGNSDYANLFSQKSLAYAFLSELIAHFSADKTAGSAAQKREHIKNIERMSRILTYISDNSTRLFSLVELAEAEHLSVPYLSKFFEKNMGVGFLTYYTDVRLSNAVDALLKSELSIEEIAYSNGFTDSRAFVRAFKKKYGVLPSLYRRNGAEVKRLTEKNDGRINYLNLNSKNYLSLLAEYLPKNDISTAESLSDVAFVSSATIDCSKMARTTFKKTFLKFATVGRAKELLYSEIQQMLTEAQKEIGFEYLKFHGIFGDDCLVCKREKNGSLSFSFVMIDKILDFILSIGLRPLIQLSFTPQALSSSKEKVIFASPFNTSLPESMEEWLSLVNAFMRHIIGRYRNAEVEKWLFCFWNEPNTSYDVFNVGDDARFYEFYRATFMAVKSHNAKFLFGTPSLLLTMGIDYDWAEKFLDFAKNNSCPPDFINLHYYSNDFSEHFSEAGASLLFQYELSRDPDHFAQFLTKAHSFLAGAGLSRAPIYITEWNLTASHRNLLNDTVFKSCYLVRNLLNNIGDFDGLGYWSLTDFIEETQPPTDVFHGGMGHFTASGIKKPTYHAMQFLSRLGDFVLSQGNGFIVTRDEKAMQILTYNYEHFSDLFAMGEGFDMTNSERYTVFPKQNKLDVSIPVKMAGFRKVVVREYVVNRNCGSVFDKWCEMGCPTQLRKEDTRFLSGASQPSLNIYESDIAGEIFIYQAMLEPLEVRLAVVEME